MTTTTRPKLFRPSLITGALLSLWTPLLLAQESATAEAATESPAVASIPVQALPEAAAPEAKEASPALLDAVVVTAQKREQNAQDVPLSVQAFNQKALDNLNISNQAGLQQAVPGLDVNSVAQFSTLYLRGIGTDAFLMGDPSVASYVDGIYFPFAQSLDQDFGAVERVEVLKGPQGTLFGRNAVGGAISVYTRNPDFDEADTSLELVYGNRDTRRLRLHQNIPLTRSLALSFSGYDNRADNYYQGTANGEPLPREFSRGGRIKLRVQPIAKLDINLAILKLIQRGAGSVFQLNTDPSQLFECPLGIQTPICIQPQTGYQGALSEPSLLRFNSEVGYGQASYQAPWFDLKVLGSHQRAESKFAYDFDGSPQSIAAFDQKRNYARVQSSELQLVSNDGSWLSDRFQWIVGGYYFKSEQGFDPAALQLAGLDLGDTRPGGISLPQGLLDLLDAINLSIPNGDVAFHALIGTESSAGFFQGTFHFTDWLALTAGGRYQHEDRSLLKSDSGLYLSDGGFQTLFDWTQIGPRDADGNRVPNRSTTNSFKPKATLELRPFHDTLFYVSYQEAIKSATYNAVALYLPPAYVLPEELKAYEAGIKTTLFDGNLQFNLAAFHYDIENLQVQFISLFQGGAVSFENAKAASVRGLDANLRLKILPSYFDRLVLSLGAALLDGRYDDYQNGSGFDPEDDNPLTLTGAFSSNNDYSGNRTVRTPRYTGTASLSKSWSVPGGRLEAGGDVYRNSGYYYAASNDPRFEQPAYTLYGARLSYLYQPWQLRLTAFGRNLGDSQYTQGLIATDFGPNYSLAPPLTYGLRLNWDF